MPTACRTGVTKDLTMRTGFSAAEIFRKYLWFLLRERKFDSGAVDDLLQLRSSLQLSDVEVSSYNAALPHVTSKPVS